MRRAPHLTATCSSQDAVVTLEALTCSYHGRPVFRDVSQTLPLRRMSYINHGLSHVVFGGAVVSLLLQVHFYLGVGLWGVASALLINELARRHLLGADAATGASRATSKRPSSATCLASPRRICG
jgi:hypothetical protein